MATAVNSIGTQLLLDLRDQIGSFIFQRDFLTATAVEVFQLTTVSFNFGFPCYDRQLKPVLIRVPKLLAQSLGFWVKGRLETGCP